MATIRRNKYGRIHYATSVAGTPANPITGWSNDQTQAVIVDESTAVSAVEGYKDRNAANTGQIAALDAKGKTLALWGEPGEAPATPKPVASLPGLAERVEKLEERVEMIEASDGSGKVIAERTTMTFQFTGDEVAALKGMLGEWAAHKSREAAKDKNERKEQQVRGEHKTPPAASAANAPAG